VRPPVVDVSPVMRQALRAKIEDACYSDDGMLARYMARAV
jgi:hypothetical protein